MNNKERIVLWMGLILIGLNLVSNWPQLKAIIFTGAGTVTPAGGNSGGSGGGGFSIPGIPKLPWWIPTWPGTNIPLVSQVTPNPPTTQNTSTAQPKLV
jgi:hypothetical protein